MEWRDKKFWTDRELALHYYHVKAWFCFDNRDFIYEVLFRKFVINKDKKWKKTIWWIIVANYIYLLRLFLNKRLVWHGDICFCPFHITSITCFLLNWCRKFTILIFFNVYDTLFTWLSKTLLIMTLCILEAEILNFNYDFLKNKFFYIVFKLHTWKFQKS